VAQTPTPQRPTPGGVCSGQLIAGRYALSRLIASGGMAEVWQATDTVLERQVAVKILHAHLGADEQFVQRFRTEAVAAARLHHPAIVSIYDTCSDAGTEAIVMELVRGQTLRQYLDDHGPLPPDEVIDIGAEVADALEAAHRSGLVHRDIKPANILLCDDHRVMVTDFGIAKIRDDPDHTTTGQMLGTVKYLAPEQVEGTPVDGRTDLYALGVVLYESIAGRAPFSGDSQAATALARLHSTPPRPRQIRPSVPRPLDDVIMRAMSRQPDDRYPSAPEFRAALLATRLSASPAPAHHDYTPVASRRPPAKPAPPPRAPRRRRSHRWVVPFLVFILVAISLSIAGILLYRTKTGENLLDSINNKTGVQLPGVAASGPLPIVNAQPFDPPPGDGHEDDSHVRTVLDGNPATSWHTEQYDTRKMGGIKPGVGLLLTVDKPATLQTLKITSPTQDWSASVYVADHAGATLADWGQPVTKVANNNGNAELDLGNTAGQYVLVWITDLGNGPPRVSTEIDEVAIIGH
jgi:serine/threonine protein kinase